MLSLAISVSEKELKSVSREGRHGYEHEDVLRDEERRDVFGTSSSTVDLGQEHLSSC